MKQEPKKHNSSGLAMASLFVIVAAMTVTGLKSCANDADFQAQKAKAYQAQFAGDQK